MPSGDADRQNIPSAILQELINKLVNEKETVDGEPRAFDSPTAPSSAA